MRRVEVDQPQQHGREPRDAAHLAWRFQLENLTNVGDRNADKLERDRDRKPRPLFPGVNGEALPVLVELDGGDHARAVSELGMIGPVHLFPVQHPQAQLVIRVDEDREHFAIGHQPPRGERLQAIEVEQAVGVGAARPLVESAVDLGPDLGDGMARLRLDAAPDKRALPRGDASGGEAVRPDQVARPPRQRHPAGDLRGERQRHFAGVAQAPAPARAVIVDRPNLNALAAKSIEQRRDSTGHLTDPKWRGEAPRHCPSRPSARRAAR